MEHGEEREGWETIVLDGQTYSVCRHLLLLARSMVFALFRYLNNVPDHRRRVALG